MNYLQLVYTHSHSNAQIRAIHNVSPAPNFIETMIFQEKRPSYMKLMSFDWKLSIRGTLEPIIFYRHHLNGFVFSKLFIHETINIH